LIAPAQAWDWLHRELDNWAESGLQARFWWRDDDAVEASQRLDRLLWLGQHYAAPLALAVIPARLETKLGDYLQTHTHCCVLQHGYAHDSHAAPGARKLELGGTRATADIVADLARGYQILQQRFASHFTPVLVPPWNRIDERVLEQLAALGFSGISTMKVRRKANPAPGLLQVNTHLDLAIATSTNRPAYSPITWCRTTRSGASSKTCSRSCKRIPQFPGSTLPRSGKWRVQDCKTG